MRGREILLGVSGGVAAYKAAAVASGLVQAGAGVSVIMTPSATRFIGATTFEALTGRPVQSDVFSPREHYQGEHIGLARRAELAIVSPATAQTLARLAHGLADDLFLVALPPRGRHWRRHVEPEEARPPDPFSVRSPAPACGRTVFTRLPRTGSPPRIGSAPRYI